MARDQLACSSPRLAPNPTQPSPLLTPIHPHPCFPLPASNAGNWCEGADLPSRGRGGRGRAHTAAPAPALSFPTWCPCSCPRVGFSAPWSPCRAGPGWQSQPLPRPRVKGKFPQTPAPFLPEPLQRPPCWRGLPRPLPLMETSPVLRLGWGWGWFPPARVLGAPHPLCPPLSGHCR